MFFNRNTRSQSDFFGTIAKLGKDYDIKKYLDDKHIKPDDGKKYTLQQIHNAILEGSGANPYLIFDRTETRIYLKEVHLCFDVNSNLVDASYVYPAKKHRGRNGYEYEYYYNSDGYPYFHTVPAISYPMRNQLQAGDDVSRALEGERGPCNRTRKRLWTRNILRKHSRSLSRKRTRQHSRNLSAN